MQASGFMSQVTPQVMRLMWFGINSLKKTGISELSLIGRLFRNMPNFESML